MRAELGIWVVSLLLALGCQPKIGDDCDLPTDCSQAGDRFCDATQPGGYCTIFNCEAGNCPDEAVCIGFSSVISALPGDDGQAAWVCADPQGGSRFQRNFCMRSCDSRDDCRPGYRCLDLAEPGNAFGAVLIETSRRKNGKVCIVPMSSAPEPEATDAIPGICTGNPTSELPPATGGVTSGGAGGVTSGGAGGVTSGGGGGASSGAGGIAPTGGSGGDGVAGIAGG